MKAAQAGLKAKHPSLKKTKAPRASSQTGPVKFYSQRNPNNGFLSNFFPRQAACKVLGLAGSELGCLAGAAPAAACALGAQPACGGSSGGRVLEGRHRSSRPAALTSFPRHNRPAARFGPVLLQLHHCRGQALCHSGALLPVGEARHK